MIRLYSRRWCERLHRPPGRRIDPKLRYAEDVEFVFRLACKTSFCFVGISLVLIDRAPGEQRHVNEAKNFDNELFRLQLNQYRFEKRLKMATGLSSYVRRSARKSLKKVHRGLANFYLV